MSQSLRRALPLVAAGLLLAGCGQTSSLPSGGATTSSAGATASVQLADATSGTLHLSQGWVVAASGGATSATPMPSASATSMPSMSASGMPMDGSTTAMASGAMSAAYAVLTNDGATDDALVSVSTPAAEQAQLHETTTSAGAGTMQAVASVPVPAHGTATLQTGGYHVMLLQLRQPLAAGSSITMTWTFRSGTAITTTFPVIARQDRPGA